MAHTAYDFLFILVLPFPIDLIILHFTFLGSTQTSTARALKTSILQIYYVHSCKNPIPKCIDSSPFPDKNKIQWNLRKEQRTNSHKLERRGLV